MLVVNALPIRPDALAQLRAFGAEVTGAQVAEARQGWTNEGTREELAFVLEAKDGPIFIVVQSVDDPAKASAAFERSTIGTDQAFTKLLYSIASGPPLTPERIWEGGTDAQTVQGPAAANTPPSG